MEVMKFLGAAIGGIVAGVFLGKFFSKKEEVPDEMLVRVWVDEARKSKLIAEAIVKKDGEGWSGGPNGMTVDPLGAVRKEERCAAQEQTSEPVSV